MWKEGISSASQILIRKAYRKKLLFDTLKNLGFIDFPNKEDFLKEIQRINPYILRAEALERQITTVELSRIFYHFIKRRGFLSNRKQLARTKKRKEVLSKRVYQLPEMQWGEYIGCISRINLSPDNEPFAENERIRKRFTSREMYVDEFNKIWTSNHDFIPIY
jgi:CRISPR-associated endonuclease Csn1